MARSGLDELPQFLNVLKGEMSLVGSRPLPVDEAEKLTAMQKPRQLVKPGITSPWVVDGAHEIKFTQWMNKDIFYVAESSLITDVTVLKETTRIILRYIFDEIK